MQLERRRRGRAVLLGIAAIGASALALGLLTAQFATWNWVA